MKIYLKEVNVNPETKRFDKSAFKKFDKKAKWSVVDPTLKEYALSSLVRIAFPDFKARTYEVQRTLCYPHNYVWTQHQDEPEFLAANGTIKAVEVFATHENQIKGWALMFVNNKLSDFGEMMDPEGKSSKFRFAELAKFCVHPDYRKLGLGSKMMDAMEQHLLRSKSKKAVKWYLVSSDKASAEYYKRRGWEKCDKSLISSSQFCIRTLAPR